MSIAECTLVPVSILELEPLDPAGARLHEHLRVLDDGEARPLTVEGMAFIKQLALNDPQLVAFRRRWIGILRELDRLPPGHPLAAGLWDCVCFPDDLPDLKRLRPPKGNTRP